MSNLLKTTSLRDLLGALRISLSGVRPYVQALESKLNASQQAIRAVMAERDRLAEELGRYKHAFETTAVDRDRLAGELTQHKHALKTTASDRDCLSGELAEYKHAFETTASDRDRLAVQVARLDHCAKYLLHEGLPAGLKDRSTKPLPPPQKVKLRREESESEHSQDAVRQLFAPNAFAVGAPKSGTSYLYSILRMHPRIFLPTKDSGYLTTLHFKDSPNTYCDYLDYINKEYDGQPVLCEFSADFFTFPDGAKTLCEKLCPDARVIFCLRDPVQRALSEYRMRVLQYAPGYKEFRETEEFYRAIELESYRSQENPERYLTNWAYIGRGKYFNLIKNYIDQFGKDNLFISIFESEIANHSERTIMNLFSFLSICDVESIMIALDDHTYFKESSRGPQSVSVSFLLSDGEVCDERVSLEKLTAGGVTRMDVFKNGQAIPTITLDSPSLRDIETALTAEDRVAFELDLDQRRSLYNEHFSEDIAKLEELLDRDLSIWYSRY